MMVVRRSGAMWLWYKMRLLAGEKCFLIDVRVATVKAWLAGDRDIYPTTLSHHSFAYHSRLWRLQDCSAPANALGFKVEARS